MQKNVQIPYELYINLIRFHLLELDENEQEIRSALEKKLRSMADRGLYTKYKTAGSENEREDARRQYLDNRGIPEDFRW